MAQTILVFLLFLQATSGFIIPGWVPQPSCGHQKAKIAELQQLTEDWISINQAPLWGRKMETTVTLFVACGITSPFQNRFNIGALDNKTTNQYPWAKTSHTRTWISDCSNCCSENILKSYAILQSFMLMIRIRQRILCRRYLSISGTNGILLLLKNLLNPIYILRSKTGV